MLQSVGLKRCEIVQQVAIVTELFILRSDYFSIEHIVVEKCVPQSGNIVIYVPSQHNIKDTYLTGSWPHSLPDNS